MSSSFWITAVVLAIGLAYKIPAFLRGGRNPMARQVVGLLVAACGVFFFAAPSTIAWLNDVTGITNFSAPWVYSLLSGFSASCLLLIVKWRGGPQESVRRTTLWVYGSYGVLIVGVWTCFILGDHHVERLRDLDTYYATTPWMREMILLYLLAHTVAVLVTSALLWTWARRIRGTGWLHAGVILLSVGYALNLVYDALKLTAVIARWTGRTDLDWLSTNAAPPAAGVVGVLIGLGFILPHAGERISRWASARREYRALAPLARALQDVPSAASPVPIRRFATLDLRLMHRKTLIRDALRQLQPHLTGDVREQALQTYLDQGKPLAHAQVLAEVTAIVAEAATSEALSERPSSDLVSTSRALRHLPVHEVRWNMTQEKSVTS